MNMKILAVILFLIFFVLWIYYPDYHMSEKNQTIYIIGGAVLLYHLFNGKKSEMTEESEDELGEEEDQLPH